MEESLGEITEMQRQRLIEKLCSRHFTLRGVVNGFGHVFPPGTRILDSDDYYLESPESPLAVACIADHFYLTNTDVPSVNQHHQNLRTIYQEIAVA